MKASEIIKALEKLVDEHGDLKCLVNIGPLNIKRVVYWQYQSKNEALIFEVGNER